MSSIQSKQNAIKKIHYLETALKIEENGNVKEVEQCKIVSLQQEPPYIKMYIEDLTAILKLPSGTKDLLYLLLLKMDYENMVTLTSRSKKEIADRAGMRIQTFDNYLKKLVDADVFKRIGRGEYKVNPSLFARGEWNRISKQRDEWWTLTVTYKNNGEKEVVAKPIPAQEAVLF